MNEDALAFLTMYLQSLGLGELASWAQDMLTSGASADMITLQLRNQPAYRKRFAAIFDREAAGLAPISATDVLNYETQARQVMQEAGLPEGFYDSPDDFRRFIGQDVSLRELSTRVSDAFTAIEQGPQDVISELQRLYGVSQGGLAAWALDEKRALPVLQRQVAAAQIGGAGATRGFQLDRGQLENLAALGVSRQQAVTGFANLQTLQPLFTALPGEQTAETITQEQQIAAQFGTDVAAQQAIERRQRQRQTPFEQGGEFAAGAQGISGLGTASR